ncbi:MAG: acyl-CoA thioesterase, partial [Peptostreptococcaceae bacterium]
MKYYDIYKLVKSEDLNHHGTLFAGRMAEWFVESCFITAANEYRHPENLVCLKIHELKFSQPVSKGAIINIQSKIINIGNTSINVYGKVTKNDSDKVLVEGFLTFVCVDENGSK